ncbi:hypothetical protein PG999_009409 [Apiospora kogelbergensis]|uniref:Uncharacterized protein n=1 Tax=Apiospora kogelbergensis TaxID=1337665 RepID=A0AAW0QV63_9PEZI
MGDIAPTMSQVVVDGESTVQTSTVEGKAPANLGTSCRGWTTTARTTRAASQSGGHISQPTGCNPGQPADQTKRPEGASTQRDNSPVPVGPGSSGSQALAECGTVASEALLTYPDPGHRRATWAMAQTMPPLHVPRSLFKIRETRFSAGAYLTRSGNMDLARPGSSSPGSQLARRGCLPGPKPYEGCQEDILLLEANNAKPMSTSCHGPSLEGLVLPRQAHWPARGDHWTGAQIRGLRPQQQISHNVLDLGCSQVTDEWPIPTGGKAASHRCSHASLWMLSD